MEWNGMEREMCTIRPNATSPNGAHRENSLSVAKRNVCCWDIGSRRLGDAKVVRVCLYGLLSSHWRARRARRDKHSCYTSENRPSVRCLVRSFHDHVIRVQRIYASECAGAGDDGAMWWMELVSFSLGWYIPPPLWHTRSTRRATERVAVPGCAARTNAGHHIIIIIPGTHSLSRTAPARHTHTHTDIHTQAHHVHTHGFGAGANATHNGYSWRTP